MGAETSRNEAPKENNTWEKIQTHDFETNRERAGLSPEQLKDAQMSDEFRANLRKAGQDFVARIKTSPLFNDVDKDESTASYYAKIEGIFDRVNDEHASVKVVTEGLAETMDLLMEYTALDTSLLTRAKKLLTEAIEKNKPEVITKVVEQILNLIEVNYPANDEAGVASAAESGPITPRRRIDTPEARTARRANYTRNYLKDPSKTNVDDKPKIIKLIRAGDTDESFLTNDRKMEQGVIALQNKLNESGAGLVPDGAFGPLTRDALYLSDLWKNYKEEKPVEGTPTVGGSTPELPTA